jgi:hypothetical protein
MGFIYSSLTLACFLALGTVTVKAQLYGCDAVQCPRYSNGSVLCDLGDNVVVSELGLANVTSFIPQTNFTFTVIANTTATTDSNKTTYDVSEVLYLGIPSNINLQSSSYDATQACSFSMFGQKQNLTSTDGTCVSAFGQTCVTDLETAVTTFMSAGAYRGFKSGSLCTEINEQITNQLPASCKAAGLSIAATVPVGRFILFSRRILTSIVLSGIDAPKTKISGSCNPSFPGNSAYFVAAWGSDFNYTGVPHPFPGITPIVTVWRTNGTPIIAPTAQMSCIQIQRTTDADQGKVPSAAIHIGTSIWTISSVVIAALLLLA